MLVGSRHTAESLWEVMDDPELPARTRLGPPGVDVHEFRRRSPAEAAQRLAALADRLDDGDAAAWGGEPGAAAALRALDPARDRIVSYVGKLIVSKGVDLLLAAWPLVVAQVPDARLCIVGFGTYRDGLRAMVEALAGGDLAALRRIAARGRELEGGPPGELAYLAAFLDGLDGRAPRRLPGRGAGGRRAGGLHRPPRARRPAGAAAGLRGAGGAQHVPGGVRHGGRRGGRLRRAAAVGGALRAGRGHRHAGRGAGPEELRPLLSFERGPGAVEEIAVEAGQLALACAADPSARWRPRAGRSGAAAVRLGGGGRGGDRGGPGRLDELPEPGA